MIQNPLVFTLFEMNPPNNNNVIIRPINPVTNKQNKENHAKAQQTNSYRLIKGKKFKEAIKYCKICIKNYDAYTNRYHQNTKLVYDDLGLCYYQMGKYKLAVASFRMKERIYTYLNGQVPMFGNFELSLEKVGLSQKEIIVYISNLHLSTQLEAKGDQYRNKGSFVEAIFKYKQAICIEKDTIGNDFTIPYLYRKITQIMFICKVLNSNILPNMIIDWNEIDQINIDSNHTIRKYLTAKINDMKVTLDKTLHGGTIVQYNEILKIFDTICHADYYHIKDNYKKELRCYKKIDAYYNEQEIRLGEKNYATRI